jgi:hypothetical protein
MQHEVALAKQGAGKKLVEREKVSAAGLTERDEVTHVAVENKEGVRARIVFL